MGFRLEVRGVSDLSGEPVLYFSLGTPISTRPDLVRKSLATKVRLSGGTEAEVKELLD